MDEGKREQEWTLIPVSGGWSGVVTEAEFISSLRGYLETGRRGWQDGSGSGQQKRTAGAVLFCEVRCDYRACTFSACQPLGPLVTLNWTR